MNLDGFFRDKEPVCDIAIPISGPKAKGTIYAVGTKSAGKWEFSKLAVQVDATLSNTLAGEHATVVVVARLVEARVNDPLLPEWTLSPP